MPAATPKSYAIEIRNKEFTLKQRVEHIATNISWEWNRQGGCGRCTFDLPGNYLRFTVEADDDVRIYLPDAGGLTATLWYRGYVENATPILSGGSEGSIKIECMGYFGWLDRIVVQDSNEPKVYSSSEISATVESIIDDFIVANSGITLGTIESSGVTLDTLEFKTTVRDAIRTLFDLIGTVEYGVNANLQFYWLNQSEDIAFKFYVGHRISNYSEKMNFRDIVNTIYFEGGETGSGVLKATGLASDSISKYGLRQALLSNAAIVTSSVAQQYISSYLAQRSTPQRQITVSLKNISDRFEATLPIGAISIQDRAQTQNAAIYGTTANGGSNKIYGTLVNGGSGQLYSGSRKEQLERVVYTLSPEDGKIHAELTIGTNIGFSRASAEIKQIELIVNATRQRQIQ